MSKYLIRSSSNAGTRSLSPLEISNAVRIIEIAMKSEFSAKCLPGQIRLPNPKAQSAGSVVFTSSSKKRSGMNSLGSYLELGSRAMALQGREYNERLGRLMVTNN